MAYQVLARKWRPQNFNEVVFQEHVSKTIRNSINKGRIPHAYLFSGPRGVGKTTMARIIAKALNCAGGPTDNPCEKCENCLEIKRGNSFDVIEIDGASNRGIENIRELRENVNFAPFKSKYKIYIIDEVHMLTKEAFNALLKTLEEPPEHVVFIFATTEIHNVPETILSRCQKYFFKKISVEAIVEHLEHIVARENFKIDKKALYSIARSSDGSMRDAQSLLDQVISFSEGEVNEGDALSILGIVPLDSYIALINHIKEKNVKNVIGEVDRVISLGVDIPRYVAGFIDVLRAIRLDKSEIQIKKIMGLSDVEAEEIKIMSQNFYDEELAMLFHVANELFRDLRFSANERINLEMAFIDMISILKRPSISSLINKLESFKNTDLDSEEKKTLKTKTGSSGDLISKDIDTVVKTAGVDKGSSGKYNESSEKLLKTFSNDIWSSFLNGLKEHNRRLLLEKLRNAKIEYRDKRLNIILPAGTEQYSSRELLEEEIVFVDQEINKKIGENISILISYTSDSEEKIRPENVPPDDAEMIKNPEIDELEELNPKIKKVKDFFHGQIIDKGEE